MKRKRKDFLHRWNFSCFQPHVIKLGVFWPSDLASLGLQRLASFPPLSGNRLE
jgi:hypothetical protein